MDVYSDYKVLVNGNLHSTEANSTVINPATKQVLAKAPEATVELFEEAVSSAKAAFPAWRDKSVSERRAFAFARSLHHLK